MPELRFAALAALQIANPETKCEAVHALAAAAPELDPQALIAEPAGLPGRPARPRLVSPKEVLMRSPATPEGRVALLHSIAHIEFNAINLALDAIWRFSGLPADYYHDWLRVADEEAQHFELLAARLAAHGAVYGDCNGHDGLWTMVRATAGDALARMALVPRTLEARGLDASPAVKAKLVAARD
ncbi:MAG: ferritin-like domain-containing protein, partial [Burkholderiaceae bacterium]